MKKNIYPIGLSTCGNKPLDEKGFLDLKESGIEAIELSSSNYDDFDFCAIRANADKYGIALWSLHLPFMPFSALDPSALDADIRKYTMDFMTALIKRGCKEAGIDKYIIHPSIEPIDDDIREAKLNASASFLSELAEFAAGFGAVIAVENLPRTCLGKNSEEILRLIAANDKLRVCFDTNHLLAEDIPTFIRNVGTKIITTHVSDYDFINERHWLPGEGKADWNAIYNTLQEVGYQGVWLYEIGFSSDKTIHRRTLNCKDFYENAQCIFSGNAPQAIGTPVENLGFWGPNPVFHRRWSMTMYKNLKLPLGEMTFTKDFVNDTRGDLYPIFRKSADCQERIFHNHYKVSRGSVTRLIGQFFPYATYEITADTSFGKFGFLFFLTDASVSILYQNGRIHFHDGETAAAVKAPDWLVAASTTSAASSAPVTAPVTMIVSCRPGAFDLYFKKNGQPQFCHTFHSTEFAASHQYERFFAGQAAVCLTGEVTVTEVRSYIDNGISQADMRPIRYEDGSILMEQGKVWLTMSIRMQEEMMQGVFSWIPGTSQIELTGALYFDAGDGKWCGDVATSLLYHQEQKKWLLWVCSFSHDHILGHASFDADPRFGVNVIDIKLMEKAPQNAPISVFAGMKGDEDPDFYYDAARNKWLLAICRVDPMTCKYRYVFFESKDPFEGYHYIGQGMDGAETGGSFVRIKGELFFTCGNDFDATSDYRIYSKHGMTNAVFDHPDGGFRGWGTLMPIAQGTRTRYFWMTFDRHNGSHYNWSYGNLYCFEAVL